MCVYVYIYIYRYICTYTYTQRSSNPRGGHEAAGLRRESLVLLGSDDIYPRKIIYSVYYLLLLCSVYYLLLVLVFTPEAGMKQLASGANPVQIKSGPRKRESNKHAWWYYIYIYKLMIMISKYSLVVVDWLYRSWGRERERERERDQERPSEYANS